MATRPASPTMCSTNEELSISPFDKMPQTIYSAQDARSTYLPPSTPPAHVRQMIVATLQRVGFESAEAGALGEMERLVELHVQRLFETALSYASLSHRLPNAYDLYEASTSTHDRREVRRFRQNATKRRRVIKLDKTVEEETRTDALPHPDVPLPPGEQGPSWVPAGLPDLPPRYTYAHGGKAEEAVPETSGHPQQAQVTSASLDFVKLISTERGDIPPELGVVDYRRARRQESSGKGGGKGGAGGGGGEKRKWSTKGVGL